MAKYLAPSERFSNFGLETEIRGTPRGAPGGPKIEKKNFSKNLIFFGRNGLYDVYFDRIEHY